MFLLVFNIDLVNTGLDLGPGSNKHSHQGPLQEMFVSRKELGSYRALVKVRKSCVQMTLPMIQIGPKLHQMTSELWDSINAIQNPYSLVR